MPKLIETMVACPLKKSECNGLPPVNLDGLKRIIDGKEIEINCQSYLECYNRIRRSKRVSAQY